MWIFKYLLIIFFSLFYLMLFFYLFFSLNKNSNKKNIFFFDFDFEKKEIFMYDHAFMPKKNIFKINKNAWVSSQLLFGKFGNKNNQNIKKLFLQFQNYNQLKTLQFTFRHKKKYEVNVYLLLRQKNKNNFFITLIVDHKEKINLRKNIIYKKLNLNLINNNANDYKIIFSFLISKDNYQFFIKEMNNFLKQKNIHYLYIQDILILFFRKKTSKKLEKFKNKVLKILKKKEFLFHNLIYGITFYVFHNQIYSQFSFKKVIYTMSYFLELSKKNGKKPYYINYKDLSINEFQLLLKEFPIFEEKIKQQKIELKMIPIKNLKIYDNLIYYSLPMLKGENELKHSSFLLKSYYYKNFFKKLQFDESINNAKVKNYILADVEISWFIKNYMFLKSKKIICVFNEYDLSIDVMNIIEKLINNNFVFAIRINNFLNNWSDYLKNNFFKYIILDRNLINEKNVYKNYTDILTLNFYAKNMKFSKIIYENPINFSNFYNKKLNVKHFYYL